MDDFVEIVDLILLDRQIGLTLVGQLHVVLLKCFQFFMDSGLFFALDQALIFVLGNCSSDVGIELLFFEM